MSDEEREYSEEEEEEEEEEEKPQPKREESQGRQKTPAPVEEPQKSETELKLEERRNKKIDDSDDAWRELVDNWRKQRAKEEEELKRLKDKQAKRKTQRSQEEIKFAEEKKRQEEQRAREMEEKRQREMEEKRRRLEEAEKKRQAMLAAQSAPGAGQAAPNFTVVKTQRTDGGPGANLGSSAFDKMMNVAAARGDMGKTKEQLQEEKQIALSFRVKALEIEGLSGDELKAKAKALWEELVKLETDKYDLEERQKRQDYDLKELNERQRQINRNRALKKGLDAEALQGAHPPKIQVASKYERRIDRRSYGDKKNLYDGGYEASYCQSIEKVWEDRMQNHIQTKGKLPRWVGEQPGKRGIGFADEAAKHETVVEEVEEVEVEEDEE